MYDPQQNKTACFGHTIHLARTSTLKSYNKKCKIPSRTKQPVLVIPYIRLGHLLWSLTTKSVRSPAEQNCMVWSYHTLGSDFYSGVLQPTLIGPPHDYFWKKKSLHSYFSRRYLLCSYIQIWMERTKVELIGGKKRVLVGKGIINYLRCSVKQIYPTF